jgi:uncharacterized protein (TIGR02757 family)
MIPKDEIKEFLDFKVLEFNRLEFIELDPISIPHRYNQKEDIEISAFITATISWGNRKAILKSANKLFDQIGESPYDFVLNAKPSELDKVSDFYYRTFNGIDLMYFLKALRHIYKTHGGMETLFVRHAKDDLHESISQFHTLFFELAHEQRTKKHVSNPASGSAAKRLHMMLRWLVRKDNKGVDFGIWKEISQSKLSIPLDVHSGNTARKLGLLARKQNDAKAVQELDKVLRSFDPLDPVKYDFALFGLGVNEKF